MQRTINKRKAKLSYIILMSFMVLAAFGCKEAPTLVEFLEMDPAEADLLDVGARYQIVQEILWLLDDPVGDKDVRILDITIDDQNPQTEYGEVALISLHLIEKSHEMKELKSWEGPMAPGSIIDTETVSIPDIDEFLADKVRFTFDFDAGENPWGTVALEGLNGYSEMEILMIMADFAAPYIRTALARYTNATEASVRVVRAEGAPFFASYDQTVGELSLNPNYLHLVSLLPTSTLSQFAEKSTTGLDEFELCKDYLAHKLAMDFFDEIFEEPECRGIIMAMFCSLMAAMAYVFVLLFSYPLFIIDCFHFLFVCGTIASSAAGTLPLAGLVLLPLASIKIINRVRNRRSCQLQDREGWTAKVKKSRLGPVFLYSVLLVTFAIVVLCVIFLGSADAWAENPSREGQTAQLLREEKDFGINAVFGGPAVVGGLQLGFNPHARVGLDIGEGISAAPTVYLEGKYYFMSKNFTPYVGLGAAYWNIPFFGWPISSAYIYPTLGIQYMFDNGLSLSLHAEAFVGASTGIVFPYGGLTVGWYF